LRVDNIAANPFKGLRPYEENDQVPLFGRDRDLVVMQDRILTSRTTLLFANSGVGKTSFLQARLIPEIKSRYSVCYYNEWTGQDPLQGLLRTIANTAAELDGDQPSVLVLAGGLRKLFNTQPGQRWFLILDQFEEAFQNHRWQPYFEHFINELCDLVVDEDVPARIIFAMRGEFLGDLSVFDNRIPDVFNSYYHLKHPDKLGAATIIEQTCAHFDIQVNDGKLDILLDDLCRAEPLPFVGSATSTDGLKGRPPGPFVFPGYLQLVCRRIWEEAPLASGDRFLDRYERGQAAQIVKVICIEKLAQFSHPERVSIAGALDLLITPYGAKVPCELRLLAAHLREAPEKLRPLLSRLADKDSPILRERHASDGSIWFELYHDMWAPGLLQFQQEIQSDIRQDQRRNELLPFSNEAEYLLRSTISFYDDSPEELIDGLNILGRLLLRQRRLSEAQRIFDRVLKLRQRMSGQGSLEFAETLIYLAETLADRSEPGAPALGLLNRALEIREQKLGPDHSSVAETLVLLAEELERQDRNEEAESALKRALEIQLRQFGPNERNVILILERLASLLQTLNRLEEARPLFRQAMEARAQLEAKHWRDTDLEKWIARKAFEISQHRRFQKLLKEIKAALGTQLRMRPSTSPEARDDWREGSVLLISEILDGRIHFTRDVAQTSYWRLEDCWLQNVKDRKAYLLWLARGQGFDMRAAERDYADATREVELRLFDASVKASIAEFSPVRNYINENYLSDGRIDARKPQVQALIRSKAARLLSENPTKGASNRLLAVHYVFEFYENIIAAVQDDSLQHVRRVVHILRLGSGKRDDTAVNCFEMAIAIYFLKPVSIQAALESRWPSDPSDFEHSLPPGF